MRTNTDNIPNKTLSKDNNLIYILQHAAFYVVTATIPLLRGWRASAGVPIVAQMAPISRFASAGFARPTTTTTTADGQHWPRSREQMTRQTSLPFQRLRLPQSPRIQRHISSPRIRIQPVSSGLTSPQRPPPPPHSLEAVLGLSFPFIGGRSEAEV